MPSKRKKTVGRQPKKKSLEDRITAVLSEWATFLGLAQSWEIGFEIVDKLDTEGPGGHESAAQITVRLPYRRAELSIIKSIEAYSDYDLEQCMLHELLHIPLAPIMSYLQGVTSAEVAATVNEQVEDSVDFMTRVILRMKYEVNHVHSS